MACIFVMTVRRLGFSVEHNKNFVFKFKSVVKAANPPCLMGSCVLRGVIEASSRGTVLCLSECI